MSEACSKSSTEEGVPAVLPAENVDTVEAHQDVAVQPNLMPSSAVAEVPAPKPLESQKTLSAHKVTIKGLSLGFLEVGPFEFEWPKTLRRRRVVIWLSSAVGCLAIAASVLYGFSIQPLLQEARNMMRRGDYGGAQKSIDLLPSWSRDLPWIAGMIKQVAFGTRLERGVQIRSLSPELQSLEKQYGNDPDVLVFLGLRAYFVDKDLESAITEFTLAAKRDREHVEAHFLAASRYVELATVLRDKKQRDDAQRALRQARELIEGAIKSSPYAKDLPRYAIQMADLYEREGNWVAAKDLYESLSINHAFSAVQSAFLSWRIAKESDVALTHSLESIESWEARLEGESPATVELEGWKFRGVTPGEFIHIHSRNEKLCLLQKVREISQSLLERSDASSKIGGATLNASAGPCRIGETAKRIFEAICVQAITAQNSLPVGDGRSARLEDWKVSYLDCKSGGDGVSGSIDSDRPWAMQAHGDYSGLENASNFR